MHPGNGHSDPETWTWPCIAVNVPSVKRPLKLVTEGELTIRPKCTSPRRTIAPSYSISSLIGRQLKTEGMVSAERGGGGGREVLVSTIRFGGSNNASSDTVVDAEEGSWEDGADGGLSLAAEISLAPPSRLHMPHVHARSPSSRSSRSSRRQRALSNQPVLMR